VAALEANNFGRTQEDIVNAIMHIMTADLCHRTIRGKAVNRKRIDREPLGTPVGKQLEASDESGASPKDIELVMTLATSSRSTAVAALEANNFGRTQEDIVNGMTAVDASPKDIELAEQ
jgi:hypothetical protein